MNLNYKNKCDALLKKVDEYTESDIIIAFSGGVDSSLLLKLACKAARKKKNIVYAVTVCTELQPVKDEKIAKKVAEEAGAKQVVINIDELNEAGIINNPENRCYLCKKYLFQKLKELSKELKVETILDGTNYDDLHTYRPGIKALKELGIISPLADCKMTKAEVRSLAEEYAVSVADRPSTPCLATRFPYGTKLSYKEIKNVEILEEYLKSYNLYNVRLRVHGDIVRIEVDEKDMMKILENRKVIIQQIKKAGYKYITLDLEGFRSGSMDERNSQFM